VYEEQARLLQATPAFVPDELIPQSMIATVIPDPHACPKCGKIVKQGKVMHMKWCKGK
jgi:hypothetical protein